jgi:hypothetical protein
MWLREIRKYEEPSYLGSRDRYILVEGQPGPKRAI